MSAPLDPASALLDQVVELGADLPIDTLQRFERGEDVVGPAGERLAELEQAWRKQHPEQGRAPLAFALLAAARAAEKQRNLERVELVWTGPGGEQFGLRRIEPVLLELIHSAKQRLLLVTYVAYEIDEVRAALREAAQRGVSIRVVSEHEQSDGGKLSHSQLPALIQGLPPDALQVFQWPQSARPRDEQRTGSLHAKCAVADDHTLIVSSANFTGHAMSLNMELGVRVQGGPLPQRVRGHFEKLMRDGDLVRVAI